MASALQPCLEQAGGGASKEVCVFEKVLGVKEKVLGLREKVLGSGSTTELDSSSHKDPKCSNISRRCEAIAMLVHVSILTAQLTCPKPASEGAEDREGKKWKCTWRSCWPYQRWGYGSWY